MLPMSRHEIRSAHPVRQAAAAKMHRGCYNHKFLSSMYRLQECLPLQLYDREIRILDAWLNFRL